MKHECVPSGTDMTSRYTRMVNGRVAVRLNMLEAAKELGVERRVISELIKTGHLPASQVCALTPSVIHSEDLYSAQVQGVLQKANFARRVQKIKNSSH